MDTRAPGLAFARGPADLREVLHREHAREGDRDHAAELRPRDLAAKLPPTQMERHEHRIIHKLGEHVKLRPTESGGPDPADPVVVVVAEGVDLRVPDDDRQAVAEADHHLHASGLTRFIAVVTMIRDFRPASLGYK